MLSICLATPFGFPAGSLNGSGRVGFVLGMTPNPRGSGKKGQNPTRPDPFGSLIETIDWLYKKTNKDKNRKKKKKKKKKRKKKKKVKKKELKPQKRKENEKKRGEKNKK